MRLARVDFRAMGSPCALSLWVESDRERDEVARACRAEVERLEAKFSRYRESSLTTRINRSAGSREGVEVDPETASLLDFAAVAHRESEGRFDPTSGVLRRVWDFKSGRVPSAAERSAILAQVGWSKVSWAPPRIALPLAGMELDWGGFVKEYAADRVAELCRSLGVSGGLVDLGGDLAVVGPHPGGQPWLVGIRDPRRPERPIGRIALRAGGLATSGDYERCMIVDGIRYCHLLDPRTGESFREGPASISITGPHCLVAGVSATIAMLHPEKDAKAFLAGLGLPHLMIAQSGEISGTIGRDSGARGRKDDEVGLPTFVR